MKTLRMLSVLALGVGVLAATPLSAGDLSAGLPERVVEVETLWTTPAEGSADALPSTLARVRVVESLRGDFASGDELTLRAPGGIGDDGGRVTVLGAPQLREGSRSLVALEPAADGTWRASRYLPSTNLDLGNERFLSSPGRLLSIGDKCLDVLNSGTEDGTPVVYFQCTGNPNQEWRFDGDSFQGYLLRGQGKCLVPGEVGPSGFTEAVLGTCTNDTRWRRFGSFPGGFRLQYDDSDQCLDVLGSSTDDLTPIILFECTGNQNQTWRFEEEANGACFPTSTTLCLDNNRFRVRVDWRDFNGVRNSGRVVLSQGDSGVLWFFQDDNWEMLMKVLDGCGVNNHYWVYFAATTNVEFTVEVTDTLRGVTHTYFNPLGQAADAVTDTTAFATCP
ncbi:MAG: ricin-type beta-trefoil lectin domain protein [Acidobacteriota bacterium]